MRSQNIGRSVFYHGTPSLDRAEGILRDGLIRPDLMEQTGRLAPVQGHVYLSPSLSYALEFVLKAPPGQRIPEKSLRQFGETGFLFLVPGEALETANPDEDSVGWFYRQHSGQGEGDFAAPPHDLFGDIIGFNADPVERERVWRHIDAQLPERTRFLARNGWRIDVLADAGKRALETMPSEMKQQLVEWGANLAHLGPVAPTEAWSFDKRRSEELAEDPTLFFQIAEQVDILEFGRTGAFRL